MADIDNTDIESLFPYLGFLVRQKNPPGGGAFLTVGGRKYRKVSADQAGWL